MNNFAYSSQKPEVVGPKVAEVVGRELGIAAPPFGIEMADAPQTSARTVIGDIGRALAGGKTNILFTIVFRLNTPRPLEVRANVMRQGVGTIVTNLFYSTPLTKDVDAVTSLDERKPRFNGGQAAAKLNSARDLLKRADKLARGRADLGGLTIKIQRMFTIFPAGAEPPTLAAGTLARPTSMGMNVALDLNEFLDLAGFIEKIL